MTVDRSLPASPLAAWAGTFEALHPSIQIAEDPFLTQLNMRVDPGSVAASAIENVLGVPLPRRPCRAVTRGDVEVLWLGPDEWLVLGPPERQARLETQLRNAVPDGQCAITDVSAQRTALTIAGEAAVDVLAQGCSIDLHPSVSPAGACFQTLLAQAGVILVVRNPAVEYRILVRASFAAYLAGWLVDASAGLSNDDVAESTVIALRADSRVGARRTTGR